MLLSPDFFSITTVALDILACRGVCNCHPTLNCLNDALSNSQCARTFPIFIVMAASLGLKEQRESHPWYFLTEDVPSSPGECMPCWNHWWPVTPWWGICRPPLPCALLVGTSPGCHHTLSKVLLPKHCFPIRPPAPGLLFCCSPPKTWKTPNLDSLSFYVSL